MVNVVLAILVKAWDEINDSDKDEEACNWKFAKHVFDSPNSGAERTPSFLNTISSHLLHRV